jgi:hypothetical protein
MSKNHRKSRTRAHVISDLSINHVEKWVLLCGWIVQRFSPDYGLDLLMTTFNRRGEIENGDVRLQIKATSSLKRDARRKTIAVRLEWRDMVYWLNEPLPVILVVYEARSDRAWWLYLNETLRAEGRMALTRAKVTIRVPKANVLDSAAVRRFRRFRNAALARTRG